MASISIILPCQNEEQALPTVLTQLQDVIKKHRLDAEIIVSDSSTDASAHIAQEHGVRVIKHGKPGYGTAIREGICASTGTILVFADADATYDFTELPKLLKLLKKHSMVLGSRTRIEENAMPWMHRYIGTPVLNTVMKVLHGITVSDSQSGFRVFHKETYDALNIRTTGFEFASELLVTAHKNGVTIIEEPIRYVERIGESKLRSFRDGMRHLKYLIRP